MKGGLDRINVGMWRTITLFCLCEFFFGHLSFASEIFKKAAVKESKQAGILLIAAWKRNLLPIVESPIDDIMVICGPVGVSLHIFYLIPTFAQVEREM